MDLTRQQRWILANQYRILEKVDPDQVDAHKKARMVITRGYSLAYDWYSDFLWDEKSPDLCNEVIQILDMFRAIKFSLEDVDEPQDVDSWQYEFQGFDGNEEAQHLGFADFLIEEEGKWTEHAEAGDDRNSHMPMLPRYRQMLEKWREMGKPFDLSTDQIADLATADD